MVGKRPSLLSISGNDRTGLQVGMWRETAVSIVNGRTARPNVLWGNGRLPTVEKLPGNGRAGWQFGKGRYARRQIELFRGGNGRVQPTPSNV